LLKKSISYEFNLFTEEHQSFRESLKILQRSCATWEKTGTIERFIWKKFGEMGYFGIAYPGHTVD
jgi:hypothetical protein